jgi:CRISPR-associated exonuclease Cas4
LGKFRDEWLKRQQRLPVSDIAESFVSVTDIKHYVYCPRLVYFDRVLHAAPVFGSQQEDSKELHEDYVAKELRRKDAVYYSPEFVGAEKFLFTTLSSGELGLQGNVDCIIKTAKGEFVPVEYKNMSSDDGPVCMDHKYQLVAYALLIEENFGTIVKQGFVNYIMDSQHDRGQYDCARSSRGVSRSDEDRDFSFFSWVQRLLHNSRTRRDND